MTDAQIEQTVKDIINKLHDPKDGFRALQRRVTLFLRANGLSDEQINKHWSETLMPRKLTKMAAKRGVPEDYSDDEKIFAITGRDVVENRFERSCGNKAKAFAYLAQDKGLDVRILVSTRMTNLIDGMVGHTVPCVKMSDEKYHAFDPALPVKNFKFIDGKIQEGAVIYHRLEDMEDTPYKIRRIMTPDDYERDFASFETALTQFVERPEKTKWKIAEIQMALNKISNPRHKKPLHGIYEFLSNMPDNELGIDVVEFRSKRGVSAIRLRVMLENDFYLIGINREYVMLRRQVDFMGDKNTKENDRFEIVQTMSPDKYMRFYHSMFIPHKQND